ncbi:MAG TPA: hypothetical protein VFI08_07975 [Spirochaetia bacterium]|nr:hypothetical protein [Spirochaetia bacterium]
MPIEITQDGSPRLAVSAGSTTRGTALSRLLSLRGAPGWRVQDGQVREWRFEGVTERDGTTYLFGPPVTGTPLAAILRQEAPDALPRVGQVARALLQLSEGPAGWIPVQSDSILIDEKGSVLVLPPAVDRELRELRPFPENRETYEALHHPDLTGETSTVFSLCAALYRIMTGRFPFWADDAEELHSQARGLEVPPPAILVPGLDEAASQTVMAGLRGRPGALTLQRLTREIEQWQQKPLVRPPTAEERESALKAAAAREAASRKSFRRQRFWQKNWRTVAIAAAVVIVVGALAGSILKNVLAPRPTRGFPPARVVQTFYSSMNTLDHTVMESCVVGGAGKAEINEAMTLYVTSRVTQGYEGRSNIQSAAEWDAAGRPPLRPLTSLFGVTNLSVTQEQAPPQPVYVVTYQMWNPAPAPDTAAPDSPPRSEGHSDADRVWLRQDRGDWVIYRIDHVSSAPLPAPPIAPAP